jgi:hypothetical protein
MNKNKMFKYYIGLGAIGVFTLVLLGIVFSKGSVAKQDNVTSKQASIIATKLNEYVINNKKLPESFDSAGIKDVPSTITYKKVSDSEYKFCATYNKAYSYSSGLNGLDATSLLYGAALRQASVTPLSTDSYDSYQSSYKASTLYPTYSYKKGENCQNVQPYLTSSSYNYDYNSPSVPTKSVSTIDLGLSGNPSAKARDVQRKTKINSLHSKLEEYYNNQGEYPSTFTASTFTGMDASVLLDPNNKSIQIAKAVTNETSATTVPTASGANFVYIPVNCTGSGCTGYVLKSYIEAPSASTDNPYVKYSLN